MSESEISNLQSWRYVIEVYQTCAQKYARLMNEFEITSSQFDVMASIDYLGDDASPKHVAHHLLVTKGNITSVTRRLIERQLISQQANKTDGRSVIFALTESGKELLLQAKMASKKFVDEQLAPFSQNEIVLVGTLMKRMREHLDSDNFERALAQIMMQSPTQAVSNE